MIENLKQRLDASRDPKTKADRPAPGRAPQGVVRAVRTAALVLWVSSAIWTGWSLNHIVKTVAVAVVLTVLLEAAYVGATLYFHYSRTAVSRWLLGAALVPVVGVLAYADRDMFGWVGVGFAAGPLVAEGFFVLAAWLSVDPAAPTAADMEELHAVLRGTAHQGALDAAKLAEEMRKLDHLAQVEIKGAELEADVTVAKAAAARRVRIASPVTVTLDRADEGQNDETQHLAVAGVSQLSDPKELQSAGNGGTETFGFARALTGVNGGVNGGVTDGVNGGVTDGGNGGGNGQGVKTFAAGGQNVATSHVAPAVDPGKTAGLGRVNASRTARRDAALPVIRDERLTVRQVMDRWDVSESTAKNWRRLAQQG